MMAKAMNDSVPPNKPADTTPRAALEEAGAADDSTFAPAMRLLGGQTKADVRTLYGVLRTIDDLVDDDDPSVRTRASAGALGPRLGARLSPRRTRSRSSRAATRCPTRSWRVLPGDAPRASRARPSPTTPTSTATASGLAARSGSCSRSCSAPRARTKTTRRKAWRRSAGDAGDEHPARHRRGPHRAARVHLPAVRSSASASRRRAPARSCCAITSHAPTPCMRRACRRSDYSPAEERRWRCPRPSTGRSCARSNARDSAASPAAWSCRSGGGEC